MKFYPQQFRDFLLAPSRSGSPSLSVERTTTPTAESQQGYLWEYNPVLQLLVKRWFSLKSNILFFHDTEESLNNLGVFLLEGCDIQRFDRPYLDLPSSFGEPLARTSSIALDATATNGEYRYGLSLRWGNQEVLLVAGSEEEREEWLSQLAMSAKTAKKIERLIHKSSQQRDAARRYWRRYRAFRFEAQKLKSQVECNRQAQLIRACDTAEHDKLCERVVMLEEMVEFLESRFTVESPTDPAGELELKLQESLHIEIEKNCRLQSVLSNLAEAFPSPLSELIHRLLDEMVCHSGNYSSWLNKDPIESTKALTSKDSIFFREENTAWDPAFEENNGQPLPPEISDPNSSASVPSLSEEKEGQPLPPEKSDPNSSVSVPSFSIGENIASRSPSQRHGHFSAPLRLPSSTIFPIYGCYTFGKGPPRLPGKGKEKEKKEKYSRDDEEGEVADDGEGEVADDGEGEVADDGEGEVADDGEGEVLVDGEGEVADAGEGEVADDGEGEVADDGEGKVADDGEGEIADDGEGEVADDGEGEVKATEEGWTEHDQWERLSVEWAEDDEEEEDTKMSPVYY